MKLAIFASDSGFGHVRRSVLVGLEAAKQGFEVSVFAAPNATARFSEIFAMQNNLIFHDFEPHTNEFKFQNRLHLNNPFESYQGILDDFDYVISDNHPEILMFRKDAFLSGSFLWHHVADGYDSDYLQALKNLFIENHTKIFASDVFAMPQLFDEVEVVPCGLVSPPKLVSGVQQNLLIAGGKTSVINTKLKELLDYLVKIDFHKNFKQVYVENDIFNDEYRNLSFQKADFSAAMYASLALAIIRPGIGTVTDCIANNVYMLTVAEETNHEIAHNANQIQNLKIGEYLSKEFFHSFHLNSFLSSKGDYFKELSLNGAQDVVQFILAV